MFIAGDKISILIISKPGRYRDSLDVLLSAIPDIKETACVDSVQDAEQVLSCENEYELIIVDMDDEGMHGLDLLIDIKRYAPNSKMLVVADAAIWQKARQLSFADHVSLKGFSIHQLHTIITSLFDKNGHNKPEELVLNNTFALKVYQQ